MNDQKFKIAHGPENILFLDDSGFTSSSSSSSDKDYGDNDDIEMENIRPMKYIMKDEPEPSNPLGD